MGENFTLKVKSWKEIYLDMFKLRKRGENFAGPSYLSIQVQARGRHLSNYHILISLNIPYLILSLKAICKYGWLIIDLY